MENEKKSVPMKAVTSDDGWGSNHCPFLFFGDDDAAEHDIKKIRNFFAQFKKNK